ncbi:hypothetical protein QQ045_029564 [Rhodiola kirilowii]
MHEVYECLEELELLEKSERDGSHREGWRSASVQAVRVKRSSCVSEGEGLALLGGMLLADMMGLNKVCFETDSSEVYKALCLGWDSTRWSDSWFEDAFRLLDTHEGWGMNLIGRENNSLADRLAFKARQEGWSWSVPRWVACFV